MKRKLIGWSDGNPKAFRQTGAVKLLMLLAGPVVSDLVQWLCSHHNEATEKIEASEWYGSLWYVKVRDETVREYPDNYQIAFTVDLERDCVFWSDDTGHQPIFENDMRFDHGGNCFVRSERWARRLRKKFPEATWTKRKYASDGTYIDKVPEANIRDYRERGAK